MESGGFPFVILCNKYKNYFYIIQTFWHHPLDIQLFTYTRGVLTIPSNPVFVVFTHTELKLWRRLLRPGFGHCFIIAQDNGIWFSLDSLAGEFEIKLHSHLAPD